MSPALRRLVVGMGHPDRADDAVGSLVARRVRVLLAAGRGSGLDVVEWAAPVDLAGLWGLAPTVVIVDATCTEGTDPGTVTVLDVSAGGPPEWAEGHWRSGGSHVLTLPAAVELARALGELPPRVVVIGVQGGCFEPGEPLSPPVAAAVDRAVDAVLVVLGRRPG